MRLRIVWMPSGAGMANALEQIRRWRARTLLLQVPMIASRHGVAVIEAFYVSDDLGQDAAEAVADGDDASAIKLRRLDVQQVVDATVRQLAFENIERRQFAGLFDAEAALHEQFQQRPIPERVHLVGPRVAARGCDLAAPLPQLSIAEGRRRESSASRVRDRAPSL